MQQLRTHRGTICAVTTATTRTPEVLVEVVADSVDGARKAEAAGANRIELCCAVGEGGLTPSIGLLCAVRAAVRIPVVAMLRPRRGDFLYTQDEFFVMRQDLDLLLQHGADGIVTGCLLPDGSVDCTRMEAIVRAAGRAPVTFHRAFDLVRDPQQTLEELIALKVARVLTSGLAANALLGKARIRSAQEQARGRIAVIAGAGVRAKNVAEIVRDTGVREVHLSASRFVPSAMAYANADVAMGTLPQVAENMLRDTDADEVRGVVAAVRNATTRG